MAYASALAFVTAPVSTRSAKTENKNMDMLLSELGKSRDVTGSRVLPSVPETRQHGT